MTIPTATRAQKSPQVARTVAYNFCIQQGKGAMLPDGAASLTDVTEKFDTLCFDGGQCIFYVFSLNDHRNAAGSSGFVIVAGDDLMKPIVGYSFDSPFENPGTNTRAWFAACRGLLRRAHADRMEPTEAVLSQWSELEDGEPTSMGSSGESIPALMSTRWNQGEFYFDSCPYDANAHTHALTGCVATAMAQVMAYWQRPTVGNGSHSYTHGLYGTLSANFAATHYDWSHMEDVLDENSSTAAIRAHAQLVFHCGVAVEMGYGVGGSSSYVVNYGDPNMACAENAYKQYFRFKQSLHSIFESNMTSAQWLDSIKHELTLGRPVPYAGYQSSGGHAYVIDGYDAFDRVHVNWGWGGMCDGYFELSPLPSYQLDCQAIVGVEPSDKLYGNKNIFDFSGTGGTDSMLLFTNENNPAGWTAYSNRTWIHVTPTSGPGGGASAQMYITVDSNDTEENRSGNVIIRQGNDSVFIPIVQFGYRGVDQIVYGDDTIYMDSVYSDNVVTDTLYPGYHYTIYNPGAPSGYPNPITSRLHLVAAQRSSIIMDVEYDIEEGNDYLRIFDSEDESVQLTNWTGTGSVDRLICFSGHAFINFHADGYNPGTGFVIHVYACDTFETEIRNIVSVITGNNTLLLRWIDTSQADMWRIRWGTDPRNLDQYREATEKQATFSNLDLENNSYYFRIWNNINGDTSDLCQAHLHAGGANQSDGDCPGSTIKDVEIVQMLNHSATLRWRDLSVSSDSALRWHVRYGEDRDNLTDSAFTDTNQITLTGLRNGTVYYFRIYNNTFSHDDASVCFLMPIASFETLRCLWDSMDIRNVQTYNATQTSVDLSWDDYGGGTQWWVDVRIGESLVRYQTNTPTLHVTGLQQQHSYEFVIYNNTGQTDTLECQQWHTLSTVCDETLETCINFTDFTSCLVEPWYGSYLNPREGLGAVDYGENDPNSRHTVIHTNGPDTNTGGGLMKIPQGEIASVRLGNALAGYQAEALNYLYYVDTSENDLLLLKYAAVLENPNHTADEQPHLTMRIMNADGSEIDDSCYFFDFVSDSTLGWNVHGHVLWKDWTTVGVDLSPLHGRRIRVELATHDCNQGNHFGYAYFVLRCDKKDVVAELCGSSMYNVFHAPEGFVYRWYELSNPSVTLSTTSTLTVDTAGNYRCQMSPVGNSNSSCSFEMKCFAGYRYPFSAATYQFTDSVDCQQRILFENHSYVTADEQHTIATEETIEDIQWIFEDGSISIEQSLSHDFDTGMHLVRLVSYLSNGACTDTLNISIYVTPVCPVPDTVYESICEGDSMLFYGTIYKDSGTYDYRDGMYWHTLELDVMHTTYATVYDTIVENQLPYTFLDSTFTTDVQNSVFIIQNSLGCDSVIDYSLKVWRNTSSVGDTLVCPESMPFHWNGQTAWEDNDVLVATLLTSHGADSVVTLTVHIFDAMTVALKVTPTIINFDNYHEIHLIDQSIGGVRRTWMLSDGTFSDEVSWVYRYPIPTDSVSVMLVEECEIGCRDTAYESLIFRPTTLYVPTAFMPNATEGATEEGIARFSIRGVNLLQLHVYVYDRRGLLVCEWEGQDGGWDGFYRGTPCPQASYVWVATFYTYDKPSTQQTQTGSILLLR